MLTSLPFVSLFRFTYSIILCVGLHCTRTTEEVAFGIMMCTHVLQSSSPKQRQENKK